MSSLAAHIVAVLEDATRPMSAREIAVALTSCGMTNVDKRTVNRCLYGPDVADEVRQDSKYRWSLVSRLSSDERESGEASEQTVAARVDHRKARAPTWEKFSRLLSYYLDCVREDDSQGARLFLTDEGNKYLTLHLSAEWCLSETGVLRVPLSQERRSFMGQLRQRGTSGALFYGYPLYVDWIPHSASGWSGGFAVPVFLQSVEYEIEGDELLLQLVHEWPRVNPEFSRCVLRSSEERRAFMHDLGLIEADGEPPDDGLADIVRRMVRVCPLAGTVEPLDPEDLADEPPTASLSEAGLYNRASLVIGEQSRYTRGLERELELLRDKTDEAALERSALRLFFGDAGEADSAKPKVAEDTPTVEVVPLNDEQREAVQSAFRNDLTVVTGPPGTGKSQVVLSVLASAYLRGERVLFASRNHKAVNVVETRINGLSDHPLVIRTGTRSGDRDLRAELLDFLSQVLSGSATDEDRLAEKDAREVVADLHTRREALWQRLEEVRQTRNQVDQLDQRLSAAQERLPHEVWRGLQQLSGLPEPGLAAESLRIVEYHLDDSLGVFGRIRRWFRRNRDLERAAEMIDLLSSQLQVLGSPSEDLVTEETLTYWREWLRRLVGLLEIARLIHVYQRALAALKQLPTSEHFAQELSDLEDRLWEWGARLIAATGRLLPDRLTGDTRRALGEFRATVERLAQDQIGGRAYARLRRDQERLFDLVAAVLPVWCVTNLAARGTLPFSGALFDLLVIDEASQCDFPSALPLLFRARRCLIIGDPQQLRHITTLPEYRDQQIQARYDLTGSEDTPYFFKNSLYDVAATCSGDSRVIALREHFRSHADIVSFSNRQWYGNTLRICTDYRRLVKPSGGPPGVRWTSVRGSVRRPGGGGAYNHEEAVAVVKELESLLVQRRFGGTVGVVTPFRAQANRMRDLANERLDLSVIERAELVIDVVHSFQGDERDVVLFSPCVGRQMPRGAKWFLGSTGNLFNVAITRARALLHVIGDRDACASCGIKHIEGFAKYVAGLEGREQASRQRVEFDDPRVGKWERPFYEALVHVGLKPIPQYAEHQYLLDLAIVDDDLRLDIEIDGELYHKEWDGTRCRRDVIRDLRLTALGWRVKRFWVYRIRDDMRSCVQEIVEIVEKVRAEQNNR